ncbi:MAG: acetylornithine deacetylase [Alphaproteobacteria bacterium]
MATPTLNSLDMLRRLIGYDTTSRDSNLALIDYVRDYLTGLGVESELVHDETGKKANLYATLGPTDRAGVCLSGHTDVVPVDGQEWHTNPFELTEKGGRLYGRGTSDMKTWLAVALTYAPAFLERGPVTPIHLAFSYDEEVGCIGVRRLIDRLKDRPVRPAMCIVGEPTEMKVVRAHKGKHSYRCRVRGFEAHSALTPQGVNAVEYAAAVIVKLRDMAKRKRDNGPYDREFNVPYTTIHTGVVRGGTQLNIVPKDCEFVFEFRHLPQDDPETLFTEVKSYVETELEPEMRAVAPDAGFSWERMTVIPGLDTGEEEPVTTFAKGLTGANSTTKVAFGTEAGLFQKSGIPTIICGPGSIEQAHKPNEYIAIEQVAACEELMERLIDQLCRPARS